MSHLLDNLLVFGRVLRHAGIDVHHGRLLDVVEALGHVDLGARDEVYHTCRALLVHRQDEIETSKIRALDPARSQRAQIVATLGRCRLRSGIGRLSDMVSMRTGRIGRHRARHPCIGSQLSKNSLCGRRAADVSSADEQNAELVIEHWSSQYRIGSFERSMRR